MHQYGLGKADRRTNKQKKKIEKMNIVLLSIYSYTVFFIHLWQKEKKKD